MPELAFILVRPLFSYFTASLKGESGRIYRCAIGDSPIEAANKLISHFGAMGGDVLVSLDVRMDGRVIDIGDAAHQGELFAREVKTK